MKNPRKPSSTESPLFLSIDPEPIPETLTAMGGVPLLVRAFRGLGLPASVREHVEVKQRERGLDEAEMVESFVVLNAMGGECFDDFLRLREDAGLGEMLGHNIPSPDAARRCLYQSLPGLIPRRLRRGRSLRRAGWCITPTRSCCD